MKQTPNCLQAKDFGWSERSVPFTAWMFSWNHKSRMLCDVSISNIKPPIFPNYKSAHYQVPGVMKRGISRAIYSTKAKLSPSTEVLSWIFSKGNDTVISTSSGRHRHVVVEASGTTVVAICRRGAEIINTFWFSKIFAFFAEIYCFLRKTRLLSNLARTPCS